MGGRVLLQVCMLLSAAARASTAAASVEEGHSKRAVYCTALRIYCKGTLHFGLHVV